MTHLSTDSLFIVSMIFMASVMDQKWLKVLIGITFLVLGFTSGTH